MSNRECDDRRMIENFILDPDAGPSGAIKIKIMSKIKM